MILSVLVLVSAAYSYGYHGDKGFYHNEARCGDVRWDYNFTHKQIPDSYDIFPDYISCLNVTCSKNNITYNGIDYFPTRITGHCDLEFPLKALNEVFGCAPYYAIGKNLNVI